MGSRKAGSNDFDAVMRIHGAQKDADQTLEVAYKNLGLIFLEEDWDFKQATKARRCARAS